MQIEIKDKTEKRLERLITLGFFNDPKEVMQCAIETLYHRLLINDFTRLIAAETPETYTINGLQNLDLEVVNDERDV